MSVLLLALFLSNCSSKKNSNPFLNATSAVKAKTNNNNDAEAAKKKKQEEEQNKKEMELQIEAEATAKANRTASNGAIMLEESCMNKEQFEAYNKGITAFLRGEAQLKADEEDKGNLKIGAYVSKILQDDKNIAPVLKLFAEIDKLIAATAKDCPLTGIKSDTKDITALAALVDVEDPQFSEKKDIFFGLKFTMKDSKNEYCLACVEGDKFTPAFGILKYTAE
jgi:hypothetical protein